MGTLHDIGARYGTDKATFHGFLDFYEDHLPGRDLDGTVLEIGIMHGASLLMWRDYYPNAKIIGVDNTRCPMVQGVRVHQADATDPDDVAEIVTEWGPFDVILDDGSHMTADQQRSFDLLWAALKPGGVYVMEDLHTSLMPNYVNSNVTTLAWLESDPDAIIWRNPNQPTESITAVIKKG